MKNEIVLFNEQNVKLEVNVKDETVWLTLDQMAELFGRDKSVISRHIRNALAEELDNSVVAKFATTAPDGKEYLTNYYNLDMIISVGYRVKSKKGVIFRKWANSVLKDYLMKGYAVNEKRLEYLEKTVKLINIAGRIQENNDASEIIKVINTYSGALELLDDCDHKRIIKPEGIVSHEQLTYDDCIGIIRTLKYNSDSPLFGLERNQGLKAILGTMYQTFGGKDLYATIEEKAANFLYMIIKNHEFIDGNKRIAATLFIFFLDYYDILYINDKRIIDNNTLVAITLLIAESNPKEKEVMVDLVMNFLTSY